MSTSSMIHLVLIEPEIPQNTGNIMRTAVAVNAILHLIEPFGFVLDDYHLRRSGLDYIKDLKVFTYRSFDHFMSEHPDANCLFYSRYGKKRYDQYDFKKTQSSTYLVFGRESTGIDKSLLANHLDRVFRIPTSGQVRSLNLANAVAIVTYEALRQTDFEGLLTFEPEHLKGKDFLDQFQGKGNHETDT